jgi:hypothetical protein
MLRKNLFMFALLFIAVSYSKKNNRKAAICNTKTSCPVVTNTCEIKSCPVGEVQVCETNSCAAPTSCAKLPIPEDLAWKEIQRIEAHYRGMLVKAKEKLDAASAARIKDLECQMEQIANEKIQCEVATLAQKEAVIRDMMCCELQKYAQQIKAEECKTLQAKADTLAAKINMEVKEAIRCAPTLDCNPCAQ